MLDTIPEGLNLTSIISIFIINYVSTVTEETQAARTANSVEKQHLTISRCPHKHIPTVLQHSLALHT